MSRDKVLVGHQELGRFIRDVLVANGARPSDAAVVAEGLVWANLRGGDGHGVSRLPNYVNFLKRGEIDPKVQPKLVHDRAATFVIDVGHGFGPVAVMQGATSEAVQAIEFLEKDGMHSDSPSVMMHACEITV